MEKQRIMTESESARRAILRSIAIMPIAALLVQPGKAIAQATGISPARVDTKGLTAKIKFEQVISGPLPDLNGKFKLRVTELILEPGGTSASTITLVPEFAKSPQAI